MLSMNPTASFDQYQRIFVSEATCESATFLGHISAYLKPVASLCADTPKSSARKSPRQPHAGGKPQHHSPAAGYIPSSFPSFQGRRRLCSAGSVEFQWMQFGVAIWDAIWGEFFPLGSHRCTARDCSYTLQHTWNVQMGDSNGPPETVCWGAAGMGAELAGPRISHSDIRCTNICHAKHASQYALHQQRYTRYCHDTSTSTTWPNSYISSSFLVPLPERSTGPRL